MINGTTIKGYYGHYSQPAITNLNIGEELIKTYKDGLPPSQYDFKNFFGKKGEYTPSVIDSIVVIYNNERFSIFTEEGCLGSNRNPLNYCVYNKEIETFTFIVDDYKEAEDYNE